MDARSWLRAHRRGELQHDWNPIRIERGGHVLVVQVSTDAARIGGHRENIGARGQQLLADALKALLPTALLLAERHRQATVRLTPITLDIDHVSAEQHSEKVDKKLLTGDYTAIEGPWMVSDVGKSWTIDRLSSATVAIAEGFFLDGDYPIGIYGTTEVPGVLAVRVPGAPQLRAGRHNLHQGDGDPTKPTDYSQKALFVLDACTLDGVPDSLARIYADAVLCVLVSPDGKPLPARHPGVEALVDSAEWKALEAEDDKAPDTEPAGGGALVQPARTHLGDRGLAVVAWQRFLGIKDDDGIHGPGTEAASVAWEARTGVVAPPSGTERLVAVKTPSTVLEVYTDMSLAAPELNRASKLVLMAHTFGETGGYLADWNHNYGNYKAKPGGASDWQFFACNEYVNAAQLKLAQAGAPPRDTLRPDQIAWFQKRTGMLLEPDGPSVVVSKQVQTPTGTQFIAWFFPPHLWSCFAAFKSRRLGLDFYVLKMKTRFASSWPAVLRADVDGFSDALHRAGYFTDLPQHYAAGLRHNYPLLDKVIPAG